MCIPAELGCSPQDEDVKGNNIGLVRSPTRGELKIADRVLHIRGDLSSQAGGQKHTPSRKEVNDYWHHAEEGVTP